MPSRATRSINAHWAFRSRRAKTRSFLVVNRFGSIIIPSAPAPLRLCGCHAPAHRAVGAPLVARPAIGPPGGRVAPQRMGQPHQRPRAGLGHGDTGQFSRPVTRASRYLGKTVYRLYERPNVMWWSAGRQMRLRRNGRPRTPPGYGHVHNTPTMEPPPAFLSRKFLPSPLGSEDFAATAGAFTPPGCRYGFDGRVHCG